MSTASAVLAINSGSSSVKCAVFTLGTDPQPLARETIEGGGLSCVPRLLEWIDRQTRYVSLAAIGHRIVHGGPQYRDPQRVTPAVLDALKQLIPFAPNHLPDEIALIEALRSHHSTVPQIACFDTAFHADLPEVARRLPIPAEYDARGVRRYGFHGLSYAFLLRALERIAGPGVAAGRVILAHLGNGSSLAAVHKGRSIDTTMAFTPMGGVVMSTRSGDLDPGVVTYLGRSEHLSANEVDDLLSHRAGLLGISGTSGDMRTLLDHEDTHPACRLAVAAYVYAVKKAIGALAAALGGVETLVFSGGIGEHASAIRARVCDGMDLVGLRLDPDLNARHAPLISSSASPVIVRVIPTDEELMIAQATCAMLA